MTFELLIMFYTKYRPQKFSDLIGLESVTGVILEELKKGQIGHAYFFSGPRGTGKTTAARLIAKAVNCLKSKGEPRSARPDARSAGEPCNQCQNCTAINAGRFLDLVEMDAASNRGIDDIRSLREKIRLMPTAAKFKVYIIDEVHMLTTEAFNALLKTLEEPPPHAIFVLCTTEPNKVPETIRSRCQCFRFKRASQKDVLKKLKMICRTEKAKVAEDDLKLIARAANGGFRDAETILEQVVTGGLSPQEILGITPQVSISEMVGYLIGGDSRAAISLVNEVFETGANLMLFTRELLEYLRQLLLIQVGVGDKLVETTEEQYRIMEKQASDLSRQRLLVLLDGFFQAESRLKDAPIPQLPLELAITRLMEEESTVLAQSDSAPPPPPPPPAEGEVLEGGIQEQWSKILALV
ncbi:DNA polymerase III subunit gamma/tau, partial [Candidatus Parcubacteria bacterium]|nr:DNA polymerase III subunit gamma/tau [Candidatus Parcubacteria bacterium]